MALVSAISIFSFAYVLAEVLSIHHHGAFWHSLLNINSHTMGKSSLLRLQFAIEITGEISASLIGLHPKQTRANLTRGINLLRGKSKAIIKLDWSLNGLSHTIEMSDAWVNKVYCSWLLWLCCGKFDSLMALIFQHDWSTHFLDQLVP